MKFGVRFIASGSLSNNLGWMSDYPQKTSKVFQIGCKSGSVGCLEVGLVSVIVTWSDTPLRRNLRQFLIGYNEH